MKTPKIFAGLAILLTLSAAGCKDAFDLKPENALEDSQMYQNVYDADAAVQGIYGKVLKIADRIVILNELRGDLIDVTTNSDQYLRQLNTHAVTPDNPYASPRPFYEIIMDCNDALTNFQKMRSNNKLSEDEFAQRYSDIGMIRSWLYFQLGVHYGAVPYITQPIDVTTDIKDEAKYPKVKLKNLIDSLVSFTEGLPFKSQYPVGSNLVVNIDGYNTAKFFIDKEVFLGELNLWKGNYLQAAKYYKAVMSRTVPLAPNSAGEVYYETYRMTSTNLGGGNWSRIFSNALNDVIYNQEVIWVMPFSSNFKPNDPFVDLFSFNSGKYLLKPSNLMLRKWSEETRSDGTPGDVRSSISAGTEFGNPVVRKYTYDYKTNEPLRKTSRWTLFRAGMLHLHFAEAANHDGRSKLALALLNNGIKPNYDPNPSGGTARDVTNIQQTFDVFPYDFDARQGSNPTYNATWYRNVGVRTRAGLANAPVDLTSPKVVDLLDDKLIEEGALELAFEGHRWPELLRMAMRRETSDPNYLADKIGDKFKYAKSAEESAVRSRLSTQSGWFLPFVWYSQSQ
jgi:starch-binding outer membrane protein, SusD/RagB family